MHRHIHNCLSWGGFRWHGWIFCTNFFNTKTGYVWICGSKGNKLSKNNCFINIWNLINSVYEKIIFKFLIAKCYYEIRNWCVRRQKCRWALQSWKKWTLRSQGKENWSWWMWSLWQHKPDSYRVWDVVKFHFGYQGSTSGWVGFTGPGETWQLPAIFKLWQGPGTQRCPVAKAWLLNLGESRVETAEWVKEQGRVST